MLSFFIYVQIIFAPLVRYGGTPLQNTIYIFQLGLNKLVSAVLSALGSSKHPPFPPNNSAMLSEAVYYCHKKYMCSFFVLRYGNI